MEPTKTWPTQLALNEMYEKRIKLVGREAMLLLRGILTYEEFLENCRKHEAQCRKEVGLE